MATVAGRGVAGGSAGRGAVSPGTGKDVSNREDLANFISMITRDETPFMSSIGKTKATNIYHEWQTDELAAPGNSRIVEGTDYVIPTGYTAGNVSGGANYDGTGDDAAAGTNPGETLTNLGQAFAHTGPDRTRIGNYCQINGKSIAISGTRRAIDMAGVADEYAYQLKKRGTELRRDLEMDLIGTKNVSSSGAQRTMGTYRAWINHASICVDGDGTPVSGGSSDGTDVYDDATKAALSLSAIDQVMQNIYEQGGKAGKVMLSPKLRRDFSDLMVTDSGVRRNIDMDGKLRQSVDVYMSDFGDLMVIPNYIMGLGSLKDEAALIYDPQWFSIATLRPLQEIDVGQRGDSTIGMMVEECTLEVKNPLGCGAIYNLN